jgi:hypothetical protein
LLPTAEHQARQGRPRLLAIVLGFLKPQREQRHVHAVLHEFVGRATVVARDRARKPAPPRPAGGNEPIQ